MYSQNKEDIAVWNFFKNRTSGTVLEIGANDGTTLSNSLFLIEQGWNACLIEPSSVYSQLADKHKGNSKVSCFNMAIGNINGTIRFHESGAHVVNGSDKALVSTLIETEKDRWKKVEFTETEVECRSFGYWWNSAGNPMLDYISIDCEGMDVDILKQIDLTAVGCFCLCIEHNSNKDVFKEIDTYCKAAGLTKVLLYNAENVIYVKNE